MSTACFLCFLVLLHVVNKAAATNFEQVPRDKTSIQGSTAQFLCVISDQDNCPLLVWRFTGNNEGRIIRTVGHSSTVTLDASVANNGTMIECGCRYSSSNLDYTTPVQLLVQGLLDPPSNLRSTSTVTTISLSWDAPFTLDLTDITPDITGYKITVENINTGAVTSHTVNAPPFAIVCEESMPCSSVRLSVRGLNGFGEGRQSEAITAHYQPEMDAPSDSTLEMDMQESAETAQQPTTISEPTDFEEREATLSPAITTSFETVDVYNNAVQTTTITSFSNNTTPLLTSTTSDSSGNGVNIALIISVGVAIGGILLTFIVLLLVIVLVMAAKYNNKLKPKMSNEAPDVDKAEPIYESASKVEAYQPTDSEKTGPYYSLPLPTEGCVAYGALKLTLHD